MIGRKLAQYEFLSVIGRGGMGAVYRAFDGRLRREVAIKLLPQDVGSDPERIARFRREAHTLASLSHANVASIFDYQELEGERLLVMELIHGEDLRERLLRSELTLDETLRIALQIAKGLEAAHEKGIIHRDLKPANIRLTPEGDVKIVDFGLARISLEGFDQEVLEDSPTITAEHTAKGTVLGTASYMSPEQARGETVDKRTDIWAFGVILYEMLTSERMFERPSVQDTLAAILTSSPDWSRLPRGTPVRVADLLVRCLSKSRHDRLRDIGDARLELSALIASSDSRSSGFHGLPEPAGEPSSRRRLFVVASSMLLLGAVIGATTWVLVRGAETPAQTTSLSLLLEPGLVGSNQPIIAPDGSAIVYGAYEEGQVGSQAPRWHYFLRRLDTFRTIPLENSYGAYGCDFSPDGKWIAYVGKEKVSSSVRRLYKMRSDGNSPPVLLQDWENSWDELLAWVEDDELIAFTRDARNPEDEHAGELLRIAADGGGVRVSLPVSKPSGVGLLPWGRRLPVSGSALCLGVSESDDKYRWLTLRIDLASGEITTLVDGGGIAAWSPTGHLLYTHRDDLLAVPLDLESFRVNGGPVAVAEGLRTYGLFDSAWFCLSNDGTLVYSVGVMQSDRRIATLEADGSHAYWSSRGRSHWASFARSRDGAWVAADEANEDGSADIWVSRAEDRDRHLLARQPGLDCYAPIFFPAEERVVYVCSDAAAAGGVYVRDLEARESPTLLRGRSAGEGIRTFGFWPDGSRVLCGIYRGGAFDLYELPTDRETKLSDETGLLMKGVTAENRAAALSPDGRWIAYLSDASGRRELYLRRYGDTGLEARVISVSTEGASSLWWSPRVEDGGGVELIYVSPDDEWTAVSVADEPDPRIVRRVLRDGVPDLEQWISVEPIGDGRWFGILKGEGEQPVRDYRVVTNWTAWLERRLDAHAP